MLKKILFAAAMSAALVANCAMPSPASAHAAAAPAFQPTRFAMRSRSRRVSWSSASSPLRNEGKSSLPPSSRRGQTLIVIAPVLPYSLTHDHRIVDGAAAEHFLHAFKKSIESPSPEVAELILA